MLWLHLEPGEVLRKEGRNCSNRSKAIQQCKSRLCVCSAVVLIQHLKLTLLVCQIEVGVEGVLRCVSLRVPAPACCSLTPSFHAMRAQVNSGRNIVRMALASFPGAVTERSNFIAT